MPGDDSDDYTIEPPKKSEPPSDDAPSWGKRIEDKLDRLIGSGDDDSGSDDNPANVTFEADPDSLPTEDSDEPDVNESNDQNPEPSNIEHIERGFRFPRKVMTNA